MPETPEERRARLKARLEEIRNRPDTRHPPNPPPRYDEVFFEGLAWLDSLAFEDGDEEPEGP